MHRHYCYAGPKEIAPALSGPQYRYRVEQAADLERWARATQQVRQPAAVPRATFISNRTDQWWIADQHAEHVACAAGDRVLAAGELTLRGGPAGVRVVEVTTQAPGSGQ